MPHLLDAEHDAVWKIQLRDRIMKNLDVMLQDAHRAYQRKLADNLPASPEIRYRLQNEYNQDVQNLRYIAEEEVKADIEREERERQWCAEMQWHIPEELGQALVEEQIAILNTIRNQAPRIHKAVMQEYNGALFEQGSSTRPLDARQHSHFAASNPGNYPSYNHIQTVKVETAADREARLRADKHEKQQEEFRKRAEAIQQRKRQERNWNNQLNWAETMSSSSSTTSGSDQDTMAEHVAPMTEEDVVNLVIFHDQQWTWISSLPHLQWTDFPWPFLSFSAPKRKEDLTLEAVSEYIFAPLNIHHDRSIVKDRVMDLIRRWHPDRFEVKYLARIADLHEREMVREGAGVVARILNDLLGKWNDH